MHRECELWLYTLRHENAERFSGKRVLEFGARDVNGTARRFFKDCTHVGVDFHEGDCVDVQSLFHEFSSDDLFDVAVCVNTLEHDPHAERSFKNLVRHVLPGGAVIVSAASDGYREHKGKNGVPYGPDDEHYANVSPDSLRDWALAFDWSSLEIEYTKNKEVQLFGILGG